MAGLPPGLFTVSLCCRACQSSRSKRIALEPGDQPMRRMRLRGELVASAVAKERTKRECASRFRQDGYTHVGGNPRLSVMGYNIFYIIGVIVVVAVILKFLGLY